jgi:cysteinyl-tRNA synthetase
MEAYEWIAAQKNIGTATASDKALDEKVQKLVNEFEEFMDDDLSTAKVLANMFELVSVINSIKDKHIDANAVSAGTIQLLQQKLKIFIEDIFGLTSERNNDDGKLDGVLQLLIDIRKEAKGRKDFVTSDKIRNELASLGVQLKDEKDGGMSYTVS